MLHIRIKNRECWTHLLLYFQISLKSRHKQPISRSTSAGQLDRTAVVYTFVSILFKNTLHFQWVFLKIDVKFGFFDLNYYGLTPSTSNLVDAMAMASKQLFTMRSLHVWGRCYFESFRARAFVSDSLIGYEIDTRPIKNTLSYGECYIKRQSAESFRAHGLSRSEKPRVP